MLKSVKIAALRCDNLKRALKLPEIILRRQFISSFILIRWDKTRQIGRRGGIDV